MFSENFLTNKQWEAEAKEDFDMEINHQVNFMGALTDKWSPFNIQKEVEFVFKCLNLFKAWKHFQILDQLVNFTYHSKMGKLSPNGLPSVSKHF